MELADHRRKKAHEAQNHFSAPPAGTPGWV